MAFEHLFRMYLRFCKAADKSIRKSPLLLSRRQLRLPAQRSLEPIVCQVLNISPTRESFLERDESMGLSKEMSREDES